MRNFAYEQIVSEVAESLSLPKRFVDRVYKSYWRAVREHISSLPLKDDITDEEFIKCKPNVNIPSIGKLYVTLEKYRWLKDKFEKIKQYREDNDAEDNKNQADVY